MSTATRKLNSATHGVYNVITGGSTTAGYGVILSGADDEVTVAPAGSDLAIGVAKTTAVATARVEVTLLNHVEMVEVGTGGATRGTKARIVADGWTDATAHDSDAAGNESTYGIFMQSGVAGTQVGLMLTAGNRGV